MEALKARIENVRYVIDEPATLPDGTELYLLPISKDDEDRFDIEEANQVRRRRWRPRSRSPRKP